MPDHVAVFATHAAPVRRARDLPDRVDRGRRRIAPVLGAVVLAALAACAPEAPDERRTDSPLQRDSVSTFLGRYLDAVATRDTATLRTLYADDRRFAWIEDGAVRYRTAEGVFEGLEAFPPGTTVETELEGLEVVRLGVTGAHAWASFTTSVGGQAGGYSFGGMISFLLERGDDGGWRLVGGHVSSPRPR